MKTGWKRAVAGFGAAVMLCAAGAAGAQTAPAYLWNNEVWVDDVQVGFLDGQGKRAFPVCYDDTIYIPLRTAGEWMGCTVNWEQATQTIRLQSGGDPKFYDSTGGEIPALTQEEVETVKAGIRDGVQIRVASEIQVFLDGTEQHFVNAAGKTVYPIVYRNVTYLPVRNIGELCGREVTWLPGQMDIIAIHQPLTEEQQGEIEAFLKEESALLSQVEEKVQKLTADSKLGDGAALELLRETKTLLEQMQAVKQPTAPYIQVRCGYVKSSASQMEDQVDQFISLLDQKQMTFEAMWENVTVVLPERANNLNEEITFVRSAWEA